MEGRFNRGFFELRVWGDYIWRGLFSEFYGISLQTKYCTCGIQHTTLLEREVKHYCLDIEIMTATDPEVESQFISW